MAGSGMTVAQMINGRANSGTAPIPTQTFSASNIAGTVPPKVGNAQGIAGKANAASMGGVSNKNVIIWALIIVGGSYLIHHFSFEESLKL